MAENALTGSHIAAFKGIELHKNLSVFVDSRGPRVVVHEFPFRDGAKIETLGRRPHRTDWTVTFTGPSWKDDFLELAQAIDDAPGGLLVHPIYGQMQVVCQGFDRATVNVVEATNTIVVPLTFIEDQLDIGLDENATTASVKQDTDVAIEEFDVAVEDYVSAVCAAACASFSSLATTFAAAALLSAQSQTADASLFAQLEGISAQLGVVQAALQTDPLAAESVAQVYDALAASEVVFSQCMALSEQITLETVSFVRHVVQGRTSITILAQRLYGNAAINYIDQLLALNPHVTDPTNIQAGTVLLVPIASTVQA